MAILEYLEGHFFEEHGLVEDEVVIVIEGEAHLAFVLKSLEIDVVSDGTLLRAQPEVIWHFDVGVDEQDPDLLVLRHELVDQLLHVVLADCLARQLDLYPQLALRIQLGLRFERVPKRETYRSIMVLSTLELIHFEEGLEVGFCLQPEVRWLADGCRFLREIDLAGVEDWVLDEV